MPVDVTGQDRSDHSGLEFVVEHADDELLDAEGEQVLQHRLVIRQPRLPLVVQVTPRRVRPRAR